MSILVRTILLFAALLSAPLTHALGLGAIAGNGAIGEHLDARVPLYLAPGERATLTGVDVLPDMFTREDSTPLDTLRATLAFDGSLTYVHVTSTTPLAVERMRFRLRVNTQGGAVVGRFAVRALPALRSATKLRDARRDALPIVSRSPARVAAPDAVQAGEGSYGPVRGGESLWTIASQLAAGGKVQSTMQALHALNPTAFVGGDMNRLRAGVMLTLPATMSAATRTSTTTTALTVATTDETSRASTAGDTANEVVASPASNPGTRVVGTEAVDADRELDALLNEEAGAEAIVAASPATATRDRARVDTTATTPAPRVAPLDDALAQRLAALDAKFAAIRMKYGSGTPDAIARETDPTSSQSDTVQVAPAPVVPAAVATPPSMREATPPAAAKHGPAPAAEPAPTREVAPVPSGIGDGVPGWLAVAGVAVLALLLVLALLPRINRRVEAWRTQANVASVKADDAGRKAEVARKAENRVRLESEIHDLLNRKPSAPAIAGASPRAAIAAAAPLAETTHPPVSQFEQTLDPLAITSGGALLENDREVAIDANIAHGRYAEAEALLREVIQAHPRNVQAKLRLAEVYYITEKLDGFAQIAVDIKDHHRPDLTDEEWQRVVRMGKIIAPDLALFSGPKAVGKRA